VYVLRSAATADPVNAAATIDAHATLVTNLDLFMAPTSARVATFIEAEKSRYSMTASEHPGRQLGVELGRSQMSQFGHFQT
jgi:hypothetical protein